MIRKQWFGLIAVMVILLSLTAAAAAQDDQEFNFEGFLDGAAAGRRPAPGRGPLGRSPRGAGRGESAE